MSSIINSSPDPLVVVLPNPKDQQQPSNVEKHLANSYSEEEMLYNEDSLYTALNTPVASARTCDCFYYKNEETSQIHCSKFRIASAISFGLFIGLLGVSLNEVVHYEKWTPGATAVFTFGIISFLISVISCGVSFAKEGCIVNPSSDSEIFQTEDKDRDLS